MEGAPEVRTVRPILAGVCGVIALSGGFGFLLSGNAAGKIAGAGLGLLFGLMAFWNLDFF